MSLGGKVNSVLLLRTRSPYRASQNPRTRSRIKPIGRASDERHTPAAQILIERCGVGEHVAHVVLDRDAADVPRTDVLIEHRGSVEHAGHGRDAADVP